MIPDESCPSGVDGRAKLDKGASTRNQALLQHLHFLITACRYGLLINPVHSHAHPAHARFALFWKAEGRIALPFWTQSRASLSLPWAPPKSCSSEFLQQWHNLNNKHWCLMIHSHTHPDLRCMWEISSRQYKFLIIKKQIFHLWVFLF